MRTSKNHTRKPNTRQETIAFSSGISKPAVKPFHAVKAGSPPVVQRYTEEDGAKVSENREFAVKKEGLADSELYVRDGIQPRDLDVATFTPGAASEDHPYGMKKVEKTLLMSTDDIQRIHCGDFARRATGIGENVENGTAPPGRSLYTELTWGISPDERTQRSNWGNHYAPVILADGGDRGTFETAVHVDHAWFGIYGQARGQTFRIKTVIADIKLAVSRKILDEETGIKLLTAVNEYISSGERTIEDDKYLQKELEAIAEMEGKDPDIDEKFKAAAEKKRLEEEAERIEMERVWGLFRDEDANTVWEAIKEINPSSLKYGLLHKIETKAKEENQTVMLVKIQRCKELNDERLGVKKRGGMSTTSKVTIGAGIIAAGVLIAWLLTRKKK
ncbi:hypothetical protein [Sediminibacterium ginsengisoli]|uniref:Uncharacterized protein n=1 Tax=Sediminibacterium ginsengisoli TaxID=413434 RepID=A0A1T4K1J6_9BACT|nr:hypothetical protein [Sediminibacterium ginsengisoli]SJZ36330.1 hypothetical protein SAMN04488132_101392 [Sediminibacterium ginsengisoli]